MAVYHFGPYRFEPSERRLTRDGDVISLTPKCFDVLSLLVQHRGHVVEKREIMQMVWGDAAVEETNLTVTIATLRRALNDSRELRRYIETVSKLGYRFTSEVEVAPDSEEKVVGFAPLSSPPQKLITEANDKRIHSIAVLPLSNAGGGGIGDHLIDGITESIIGALSKLPRLSVMAGRTVLRYKDKAIDPKRVGRNLGVQTVLMGNLEQDDSALTVKVELIDVANGWHLWSETYLHPLTDIDSLPAEIAKNIFEKLRAHLDTGDREEANKRYTSSTEAYNLYLKGRYCLSKRTIDNFWKATTYFKSAVDLDRDYALAYAGLADSYNMLNSYGALSPRASIIHMQAFAEKALSLDSGLVEVQASLGWLRLIYDWDVQGAAELLRIAVNQNPDYIPSRHWYAHCLMIMRRFDQAMDELRIAENLDPMSLVRIGTSIAAHLIFARKYDEAIAQCQKTLELEQGYHGLYAQLGFAHSLQGDYAAAIEAIQQTLEFTEELEVVALRGYVYGLSGQRDEAAKVLAHLEELSQRRYVDPSHLAMVHLGLQNKDEAFEWFEKAYEMKASSLVIFGIDPRLDPLRSDPRYEDLRRRIGLPLG